MKKLGPYFRAFVAAFAIAVCLGMIYIFTGDVVAENTAGLEVAHEKNEVLLSSKDLGMIHRTANAVSNEGSFAVPNSGTKVFTWTETDNRGIATPYYAVSLNGGKIDAVKKTSYEMMLRYAKFDPLVREPNVPLELKGNIGSGEGTYIVQFKTQPLEEYTNAIKAFGGKVYIYLPNHAHIVKMDSETKERVASLPFVRWIGNYEPAYKVDENLLIDMARGTLKPTRYNIMVLENGPAMQDKLAERITVLGGSINQKIPQGYRIEATLTSEQLSAISRENDVLFIDKWSAPEPDMDIVREVGGANFIASTLGYRGEGVRAEVMDGGLRRTHTDFQSGNVPLIHNSTNQTDSHGTATYGINFARGTSNPAGTGMMPEAQGIFAGYSDVTNRYTHTAELVQEPYNAVYQSNSWGSAQTTAYNTISAELDDILFQNDIALLNSQSNTGNRNSRPQAWSKNVISIGGVRHYNTANLIDDRWGSGASIGPATDGRMKPELAHFYDFTFTTTSSSNTAYTSSFGGTSGATPITAGHFGLFYQMWHNGVFGNPTGASVFESRPSMMTAKAVMINTAIQWDMGITGTDINRNVQGLGRVDLTNLYNMRNKMLIVDETDALTNLQTKTYTVNVPAGSTDPLKVTMAYKDPMGSPGSTRNRINDLTLRVTAPDGATSYWGNNGLATSMWSTAGGNANVIDTVENVFVQNPTAGVWTIEVIASEIVQDGNPATTAMDAVYGLAVSGITADEPVANASVGGRIARPNGTGIGAVNVVITGTGGFRKSVKSTPFGYYQIDGIPVGATYTVTVTSKQYSFSPTSTSVTVTGDVTNANFTSTF